MLELLKNCFLVISDSGGLQKEAFFNKKHCIIAREETEWIELVENKFATIIGSDKEKMRTAFIDFQAKINKNKTDFSMNLYGNDVGETIYNEIAKIL